MQRTRQVTKTGPNSVLTRAPTAIADENGKVNLSLAADVDDLFSEVDGGDMTESIDIPIFPLQVRIHPSACENDDTFVKTSCDVHPKH